ncbi:MAG: calcineurin [Spirochaetaceae bacterium]|nr:MAG: calcineurin [Spirochaetaceae bacterium]
MAGAVAAMEQTDDDVRPRDQLGRPGGLVRLHPRMPCVVVPDVHARADLVLAVLAMPEPGGGLPTGSGCVVDALAAGRVQLVFVGDYVHAEGRARGRWFDAFDEYQGGFERHDAMDREMAESLNTLEIVARLKAAFPQNVHALKGNHENIANEERDGNMPFGKFVYEGAMVAEYMDLFYQGAAFDSVYRFEKTLPLIAIGDFYIVGHAEPERFYAVDEVVGYRDRPEVVRGLTWTANDEAEPDSVTRMLDAYLPDVVCEERVYLGGHRPVGGRYHLRAGGRYVQIHNPDRSIVAILDRPPFDPERDVVEVPPIARGPEETD